MTSLDGLIMADYLNKQKENNERNTIF
jgi:hypothetical protein